MAPSQSRGRVAGQAVKPTTPSGRDLDSPSVDEELDPASALVMQGVSGNAPPRLLGRAVDSERVRV